MLAMYTSHELSPCLCYLGQVCAARVCYFGGGRGFGGSSKSKTLVSAGCIKNDMLPF